MRIHISGERLKSLGTHLEKEGEEVVDSSSAELIITQDMWMDKASCPIIGGELIYHIDDLKKLQVNLGESKGERFIISKWFDCLTGWRDQEVVGIPLLGLMNEGLGAEDACQGLACRFIKDSALGRLFEKPSLAHTLESINYNGFVTFHLRLKLESDEGFVVEHLQTDLPYDGLFNMLEAVDGRTTDYFTDPEKKLLESWTVSLKLTIFPWPFKPPHQPRVFLRGFSGEVQKHFWPLGLKGYAKSFYSDKSEIGISTAWASTLAEASRRALRTLRTIELPEKQFRTDVTSVVGSMWHALSNRGLVG